MPQGRSFQLHRVDNASTLFPIRNLENEEIVPIEEKALVEARSTELALSQEEEVSYFLVSYVPTFFGFSALLMALQFLQTGILGPSYQPRLLIFAYLLVIYFAGFGCARGSLRSANFLILLRTLNLLSSVALFFLIPESILPSLCFLSFFAVSLFPFKKRQPETGLLPPSKGQSSA